MTYLSESALRRAAPKVARRDRCAEPGCARLLVPEYGLLSRLYYCDLCNVPLCGRHIVLSGKDKLVCGRCARDPRPR